MKKRVLFVAAGLSAVAPPVLSQEAETRKETEPYVLGAVVVEGRSSARRTGENTAIISDQEIAEKGARSLDEALRAVPGVVVTTGAQGIPRVMIRGLPPRHTQIFLNGVPLNSSIDGQFDPSLIPVENIARLKVIQGASSVLYGPGATAGVIDIATKKGVDGVHGNVGSEIGGGGSRRVFGTVSGGFENYDFFLSGSHTERDAFKLPGGDNRENSDNNRDNLFANIGAQVGDWRLGLTVSALKGFQGLPSNTLASGSGNPFTSGQNFDRLNDISAQSAQFDAAYMPDNPFSMRFSGYANQLNVTTDRFDDRTYATMTNPQVKTFHEVSKTLVSGGQTQASYDFRELGKLTSGLAIRQEQADISGTSRDVLISQSGGGTGGGGGGGAGGGGGSTQRYSWRLLNESHATTTSSVATEYQVSPISHLQLTVGVSNHWYESGSVTENSPQWMTAASYDVTSAVQIFGSYSHKVRFPTIDQLYSLQQGNAALVPETSENQEAGVGLTLSPNSYVRISGFRNDVKNFILNDQANQIYVNRNVDISGVQVSGAFTLHPTLTLKPGYTYLDMRYPETGRPVDYRPRHVIDFLVAYQPAPDWLISGDVSYYASRSVGARSDPSIRQDLPDYALLNARIQKSFPEYGVDVYMRSTNLLDTRYEYAVGFPAAGRTIYAGLNYKF